MLTVVLLGPVAFEDPGILEYCNRLQQGQHVAISSPHPACKRKYNQRDVMVLRGSFLTERQKGSNNKPLQRFFFKLYANLVSWTSVSLVSIRASEGPGHEKGVLSL